VWSEGQDIYDIAERSEFGYYEVIGGGIERNGLIRSDLD